MNNTFLQALERRQSRRKITEQKTQLHGIVSDADAAARKQQFGTTAHPSLIGDFDQNDILAEANRIHTEHELEKHRLEMAQAENRRVQQAHLKKRLAAARAHRLKTRKLKRAGTAQKPAKGSKGGKQSRGYTQFSPKWAKVKQLR